MALDGYIKRLEFFTSGDAVDWDVNGDFVSDYDAAADDTRQVCV